MAQKKMEAVIQIRRGTYIQWYNSNPILSEGEISYVLPGEHGGKFKVGDGTTKWMDLPYTAAKFPEDVLQLSDENATSELPDTGRGEQLFQQVRNFLKWAKEQFNHKTGHKHNGMDSPRVSYSELADTHIITDYVDSSVWGEMTERMVALAALGNALHERIDGVENLGHYAGAFDTYALLPVNKTDFPKGITVNDFATIRADETHNGNVTRYIVSAIDGETGFIMWSYDVTYSTDISGKADKVSGAAAGNFAGLDASGNLADSGKAAADFIPISEKGEAGGVATLDAEGLVPVSQLPSGIGGGMPGGGTIGQALIKASSADFDTEWGTISGVGGGGKKYATLVIGNTGAGHTADDVDFLCTGTNDQEQINAAIQALPEGGGKIVVLAGTYNLNDPVFLSRDNVTLQGVGNRATRLVAEKTTSYNDISKAISIEASFCTVENLYIKTTSRFNRGCCILLPNISSNQYNRFNTIKDNVLLGHCVLGIDVYAADCTIEKNLILNCGISKYYDVYGISVKTQGYHKIIGNRIGSNNAIIVWPLDNSFTGETALCAKSFGIYIEQGGYGHNRIADNCIQNSNGSLNTANNPSYGIYTNIANNIITGNTCEVSTSSSSYGIYAAGNIFNPNIVLGNTVVVCEAISECDNYGVYAETGVIVENNNIYCSCNGIPATGILALIYARGCCHIIGNSIICFQSDNIEKGYGIWAHYAEGIISNNTVRIRKTTNSYLRFYGFAVCITQPQSLLFMGNVINNIPNDRVYTVDGTTLDVLPGSATTIEPLGTGGACGFNII